MKDLQDLVMTLSVTGRFSRVFVSPEAVEAFRTSRPEGP